MTLLLKAGNDHKNCDNRDNLSFMMFCRKKIMKKIGNKICEIKVKKEKKQNCDF